MVFARTALTVFVGCQLSVRVDVYRYSDWFLPACVVLPWAVEQYDAALVPAG